MARAAGRLNLTPSAVSHSLGRLRYLFNDPLFLRTPKGVVPTARALELGEPVADILARVGRVMASAAPFDAATSSRRFVIGAPDAIMASVMVPLSERLSRKAPRADIGLIHLMPGRHAGSESTLGRRACRSWKSARLTSPSCPCARCRPVSRRGGSTMRISWSRCARATCLPAHRRSPHSAGLNTSSYRSTAIHAASSMNSWQSAASSAALS